MIGRQGNKRKVKWDIDGSITNCETSYLVKLSDCSAVDIESEVDHDEQEIESDSFIDGDVLDKDFEMPKVISSSDNQADSETDEALLVENNEAEMKKILLKIYHN